VEKPATVRRTAQTGPSELYGLQPKYLRHNLWEEELILSDTTAEWSERAKPLPRPPLSEILNSVSSKTIAEHPDLFQIRTPINVDVFESLLKDHPNPLFVKSVCEGLREGFWPWADTLSDGFPVTHDEARPMPSDDKQARFIREQCSLEQSKGRYSRSFGTELLDGMYAMPIYAVPKPHSEDLRLVTDHSAGPFSLNNMIDHTQVTGFPLDNMRHLGEMLLDVRRSIGNVPLTMWKSDIAEAYRLLPVSPYWQIKQIMTIDGERYVDHNLAFGSSGSPGIFISVNSLVAWIAKHVKGIPFILDYVDDSSGCNLANDTLFYLPYGRDLPSDQCRLLLLWDELGIPHKSHKQISGCPLTIIGIEVDPNQMTLALPQSAKKDLIAELRFWSAKPPKSSSGSFKLKHWQRLAGWFNWALNVYPLLRPALNNVYAKLSGKNRKDQRIYINNAVRDDLAWALTHIEFSDSVHLFKSFSVLYTPPHTPADSCRLLRTPADSCGLLQTPADSCRLLYVTRKSHMDSCRLLRSLPESAGVYRSLPESAGVCRSLPESAGVCRSLPESAGVCRSLPESAGVCRSLPESAGVCLHYMLRYYQKLTI
jgi:hypothetical protein